MQRTLTFRSLALAGLLAPAALIPAHATAANADVSAGDWLLRGGLHHVEPKSNNGSLIGGSTEVNVRSDAKPSGTIAYMMTDNLGLELLVAWPFDHDIHLEGSGRVGSTKHLPPTLSLQYHFNTGTEFRPYLGAGVNYTHFFRTRSSLGDLDLDDSWGASVQAGLDYAITDDWFVNAEIRWIDIDSDVSLGGANIGTVNIDPMVIGFGVGRRF